MPWTIEVELEDDGRWIAEITKLPGVMVYGTTRKEAIKRIRSLALRALADRIDNGEHVDRIDQFFAVRP